eukprot:SAG11_NODE_23574_length_386_cov_0.902439_1_plen_73_part_10
MLAPGPARQSAGRRLFMETLWATCSRDNAEPWGANVGGASVSPTTFRKHASCPYCRCDGGGADGTAAAAAAAA